MTGHEVGEPVAGNVDLAPIQQAADFDGEFGVFRALRRGRPANGLYPVFRGDRPRAGPVDSPRNPLIHKEITLGPENRLQFTA
jgi:hypothetical protein